MSRSYSPDEMATPRDPSPEPREKEPGLHRDEEGQDQGRSGNVENQPRPNTAQEVQKPEARTSLSRKTVQYTKRHYPPPSPPIHILSYLSIVQATVSTYS